MTFVLVLKGWAIYLAKRREQYNIPKQNGLFRVTEEQRRICLKSFSLTVDGTCEWSGKRWGLNGGKIWLWKACPGGAEEFAFYSASEEKLGLSSLEIKLLFLIWIFMFSPITTWVYTHVTLATPQHAFAAWASAVRALVIQPGFRRGFSPDISLKHSHWAVVPHCGWKPGQRLPCCERLWLWQLHVLLHCRAIYFGEGPLPTHTWCFHIFLIG